ncbi:MAG: hypothetical protein WD768_22575 [Phycisphaeraceae bacterium]
MIENEFELENTRAKLKRLEEAYARTRDGSSDNEHVRELSLRTLMKRINQFKEEIIRYECGVTPRR